MNSTTDISVVLRLFDRLSGPAKTAAKNLREIGVEAKKLKGLGALTNLNRSVKTSSTGMRRLQADVRGLVKDMRAVTGSARSFAQAMSSPAANAGLREQVASWREIVRLQRQAARGAGGAGGGGSGRGGHGGGGHGRGMFGGLAAYHGLHAASYHVRSGLHTASDQGEDLDTQRHLLAMSGYAPDQRAAITETVRRMVLDMRMVTEAQGLHRFRELNYALGNRFDFARSMLEPVNKTMVAIQTSLGGEKGRALGDQVMEVVKGGELKNYIRTDADFKKWLNASTQSAIATGGNVTPQGMFQTFKYARSAVHGWGKEFLPYVTELVQELSSGKGGARGGAGVSLAAFKRMFVDSTVATKNLPELIRRGLVDPHKVDRTGANPKLLAGAFYGHDLAAKNPFEYVQKHILPAMAHDKVNLNDHGAIVNWIAGLGGTDIMKQLLAVMVIQRDQMQARVKLQGQALGYERAYQEALLTYGVNLKMASGATHDFAGSLYQAILPTLNRILDAYTKIASGASSWVKSHEKLLKALSIPALIGIAALAPLLLSRLGGPLLGGGMGALAGGNVQSALLGAALMRGGAGAAGGVLAGLGSLTVPAIVVALTYGAVEAVQNWKQVKASIEEISGIKMPPWLDTLVGAAKKAGDFVAPYIAGLDPTSDPMKNPQPPTWAMRMHDKMFGNSHDPDKQNEDDFLPSLGKDGYLAPADPAAQGAAAGKTWADNFLEVVKTLVSGAMIPPPTVAPATAAPAAGGAVAPAVHTGQINIHVHGAGNPKDVADAVHDKFRAAASRQLSDGAFA